ncbi:MAG: SpoIIE family protein phosphatase [Bryobacteraceae bacterium]
MNEPVNNPVPWHRRVRAQLAFTYLLGAGVAALLTGAFAYIAFNMILIRTAINTVERQVALVVRMTGNRADLFARFAAANALRPAPPPPPRPASAGEAPPPPPSSRGGIRTRTACRDDKGAVTTRVFPPGSPFEIPAWLTADEFAGVVFDDGTPSIRAFSRLDQGLCRVEVLAETVIDDRLAASIAQASEIEVDVPPFNGGPPPGAVPGEPRRGRPSLPAIAWFNLVGRFPNGIPATAFGYSWQTGESHGRTLFRVKPNAATTWEQLTYFGSQQRVWIAAMGIIAGAFLVLELIAAWLAFRLARRIVYSVNVLSEAAEQFGAGNLAHRIRVYRDDQLGRVGESFNRMAESIHQLIARTKENERLEEEIRVARQMQESLLPARLPVIANARLAAVCFPARRVSGDIYDVIDLGDGRVGLLCADVSGKGVPAALMMSNVQAMVRTMIEGRNGERPSPAAMLRRLNRDVYRHSPSNTFVTLFWAEYDSNDRRLRWANAGHCPALLIAGGVETWLDEGGLPIGLFPAAEYQEHERALPEGAMLVTYTDGVVEAERDDGEAFGEAGLANVCRVHAGSGPDGIIHAVVDSVRSFVDGRDLGDDLTLVVLQS